MALPVEIRISHPDVRAPMRGTPRVRSGTVSGQSHAIGAGSRLLATWFIACLAVLPLAPAAALDHVSLQLKWKHQFQFAGYYAAAAKGFYRDAGLEVELREGGTGVDAEAAV